MELSLAVGAFVVLRVEDELYHDAAIDGGLQALGDRQIAEFVEASEERVAGLRLIDEPEKRLVEVAAQPLQRFKTLLRRLQIVRLFVAEAALIGLAAGNAAVEEDIVLKLRKERLSPDHDLHRRRAAVDVLRLAFQRIEEILVSPVRLCREVVPDETLHRVIVGRDDRFFVRLRDDACEDLHAMDEIALAFRGVAALDRETEQAFRIGILVIDGKRDGVDTGDRENAISFNFLGNETHDAPP